MQLGGAAGTLAPLGDRRRRGRWSAWPSRLGLAAPALPWATSRGRVVELAGALVLVAGAAGKVATDVIGLMQTEVDEVARAGRTGPRRLVGHAPQAQPGLGGTLVVSAAHQVVGAATVVLGATAPGPPAGRRPVARGVGAAAPRAAPDRRRGGARGRPARGPRRRRRPHARRPRPHGRPGDDRVRRHARWWPAASTRPRPRATVETCVRAAQQRVPPPGRRAGPRPRRAQRARRGRARATRSTPVVTWAPPAPSSTAPSPRHRGAATP